ncbi:hypothetical protein [Sphingomonas yabuuchiae]|uniref:hypothetical protein n=1 Tax=Sphingomonas yabuuchiae TaxID=172044 RepID=UPI0025CE56D8|nr:hypothetical protein [uncultured Sphingomonas sp.]
MRRLIRDDDVARLVRAAERMARLAQDISERGSQETDASPDATPDIESPPPLPTEKLLDASRQAIAAHLAQPDFDAPAIFRNPEWILMLELFAAGRTGVAVSVKSASLTLGGSPSSANRTLLDLERLGLIASASDEKDARRRLLTLTDRAESILYAYLSKQLERRMPPMRLSLKLSHAPSEDDAALVSHEINSPADASAPGMECILQ